MFNLYQILTSAQGGRALDNLATQFGLSREEADRAVQSLMPALSTAFMTKAAQPGGLHEMATAMADDDHRRAFADPAAAGDPAVRGKGDDVAGNIFGSGAILDGVVQQAATFTGLPASTLRQMLPVIVSMVVGGVAAAMHQQGLGGMLGQLASGGIGNIFSQFGAGPGQPGQGGQPAAGGFPGMVGEILNSFMGGAQHAGAGTPPQAGMPPIPPIVQAGMDALGRMFQSGVGAAPGGQADLGDRINASMAERR